MIKTIIFDFGDVFINLDKPATQRKLGKGEIKRFSEEMLGHNETYEKGMISSRAFIDFYLEKHSGLTEADFTNSWNAVLQDFPKYRLDFIKQLSAEKRYKLILLSNTNEIHIAWIKANIPYFEAFKNCFDGFYLSHEINFRKPDRNIFDFVMKKHKLKPEESLFIDDTAENTEAAKKMGLHVWNINPEHEDVIDLFSLKKGLF